VQHLARILAFLRHEFIADSEKPGEANIDYPIKVCPIIVLPRSIPVSSANGKEALQASEDTGGIVGIQ
jgi:hypothetical protein